MTSFHAIPLFIRKCKGRRFIFQWMNAQSAAAVSENISSTKNKGIAIPLARNKHKIEGSRVPFMVCNRRLPSRPMASLPRCCLIEHCSPDLNIRRWVRKRECGSGLGRIERDHCRIGMLRAAGEPQSASPSPRAALGSHGRDGARVRTAHKTEKGRGR